MDVIYIFIFQNKEFVFTPFSANNTLLQGLNLALEYKPLQHLQTYPNWQRIYQDLANRAHSWAAAAVLWNRTVLLVRIGCCWHKTRPAKYRIIN